MILHSHRETCHSSTSISSWSGRPSENQWRTCYHSLISQESSNCYRVVQCSLPKHSHSVPQKKKVPHQTRRQECYAWYAELHRFACLTGLYLASVSTATSAYSRRCRKQRTLKLNWRNKKAVRKSNVSNVVRQLIQ